MFSLTLLCRLRAGVIRVDAIVYLSCTWPASPTARDVFVDAIYVPLVMEGAVARARTRASAGASTRWCFAVLLLLQVRVYSIYEYEYSNNQVGWLFAGPWLCVYPPS